VRSSTRIADRARVEAARAVESSAKDAPAHGGDGNADDIRRAVEARNEAAIAHIRDQIAPGAAAFEGDASKD
jgi:hypothetical protein